MWALGLLGEILDTLVLSPLDSKKVSTRTVRVDVQTCEERSDQLIKSFEIYSDGVSMDRSKLVRFLDSGAMENDLLVARLEGSNMFQELGCRWSLDWPFPSIRPIINICRSCLILTSETPGRFLVAFYKSELGQRKNLLLPIVQLQDSVAVPGGEAGEWIIGKTVRVRAEEGGPWRVGRVQGPCSDGFMVAFKDGEEQEGGKTESVNFSGAAWQVAAHGEEAEGSESDWWSPSECAWEVILFHLSEGWRSKVDDWTRSELTGTWLVLDELVVDSYLSELKEEEGGGASNPTSHAWDVTIADPGALLQCVCGGWMSEEHGKLPVLSSLNSLLQVLYKSRQVDIVLMGRRVKRRSILAMVEHPKNFSVDVQLPSKDEASSSLQRISITLGLSQQPAREGSGQAMTGFFVYSAKRLLIPFLQLSVQRDRVGRGVIGLIEMDNVFSFTMTKVWPSPLLDPPPPLLSVLPPSPPPISSPIPT
eukprot:764355-Hanusia_phi.AAC.2